MNVNGAGLRRFASFLQKKAELAQRWLGSTGIFIATAISFTVYGLIYDNTGSYDGCFMVVIALYVVAAVLVPFTLKAGNKLWKK